MHTTSWIRLGSTAIMALALATSLAAQELAPRPDAGVADDICFLEGEVLCLQGGRFRAQVEWTDFAGARGIGQSVKLTFETGYFWFFGPGNVELMVKVLDGRAINGNFWVFYGSLTNVEFTLTVTDIFSGATRVYRNPPGQFASRGDVSAFPGEQRCGGFAGIGCPAGAICDFVPGRCHIVDGTGFCVPRPDACVEIFDPVCGCDGVTYSNDCHRLQAGVAKDHDGECRD